MVLSSHIDADSLERQILLKYKHINATLGKQISKLASQYQEFSISKFKIPNKGIGPDESYKLIHDELTLDGNPTLNLASFVNTHVDPLAKQLIDENITKNLADNDEYPALMKVHQRTISILADLWNAPAEESSKSSNTKSEYKVEGSAAIGTATVGSSEAIMLGGLALKKRWQAKRRAEGKDISKPNILMGANAQVALEKFARYFDVECRLIPVCKESNYVLDLSKIKLKIDENTIGIFVILGSTYTGTFENVEAVAQLLDEVEKEKGLDIPIHVDGASGGFIAPFVYPELKWDFRIPRVHSINTSGHKFGLVSAGCGFVVWRKSQYLPDELKFQLSYLGGVEESFTLNFSRPGYNVVHQYYNFLNFGKDGYKKYFETLLENARLLSQFLESSDYYECVSLIHRKKGKYSFESKDHSSLDLHDVEYDHADYNAGLPVVAFKFSKEFKSKYPQIPQSIVSTLLRNKGFIVPNYSLPPNAESEEVLRVVVRYNLADELLERFLSDLVEVTEVLATAAGIAQKIGASNSVEARSDNDEIIKQVLLSIASSGIKTPEVLHQTKGKSKKPIHDHPHKTYRGTC